jgi:hypothetical protein
MLSLQKYVKNVAAVPTFQALQQTCGAAMVTPTSMFLLFPTSVLIVLSGSCPKLIGSGGGYSHGRQQSPSNILTQE